MVASLEVARYNLTITSKGQHTKKENGVNINTMGRWRQMLSIISLAPCAALLLFAPLVRAYNATEYATDKTWQVGMLAALDSSGEVTYASRASDDYLGVVTTVGKKSIDVASSGVVSVLVTSEDGKIMVGDKVQLSDYAGIATLAIGSSKEVGTVKSNPTNWQVLPLAGDDAGKTPIRVASLQIQLIEQGGGSADSSNIFLAAIQQTGNGIAGKSVDMWRIITALLIGIGGLILSFGLLFISSRESFFSMGRNPLAGGMIMKGLWKIVALSVVIMCTSLAASYLILRVG